MSTPSTKSSKRVCLPYPTDEVVDNTIARLHSLLDRNFGAEADLAETEAKIEKYRRYKNHLQDRIRRWKAIIGPVRDAPPEVLVRIFRFLVAISPDDIIQVCAVCKAWREVAVGNPSLWSKIIITREDAKAVQKASLLTHRSGGVPLDITYVQPGPHCADALDAPRNPLRAWNIIKTAAPRWGTLSLDFYNCKDASSQIRSFGLAPLLEELRISIRAQCENRADEGHFGFSSGIFDTSGLRSDRVPALRSLYLESFVLPPSKSYILQMLTKIHIRDTFYRLDMPMRGRTPIKAGQLLTFILNCPNLQDFSFDSCENYHWHVGAKIPLDAERLRVVTLPHLHSFQINCFFRTGMQILEHLESQNIHHASIMLRPNHSLWDNRPAKMSILQFLRRISRIRSLHILGPHDCILENPPALFERLEELYIDNPRELSSFFDYFSRKQAYNISLGPLFIAPLLSQVTIDALPNHIHNDKIAELVKARFMASHSGSGTRAIRRLLVNNCDLLVGVPPGEVGVYEGVKEVWLKHLPRVDTQHSVVGGMPSQAK